MKIALVNAKSNYMWNGLLKELSNDVEVVELATNEDAIDSVLGVDIVVFAGGHDVDANLYHEKPLSVSTPLERKRDLFELSVSRLATRFGVPQIGICRGAQLICVATGGKLIQNIGGHNGNHSIQTMDKKSFTVNSTHHQMMVPEGDYTVFGWTNVCKSWGGMPHGYINNKRHQAEMDVEVVWWDKANAIGFQYHPEYMEKADEGRKYFVSTVKAMLNEMRA